MAVFVIIEAEPFEHQLESLTLIEKQRVERFIVQLNEKGNHVGKPLGYLFFREKKFNGKRLYFLVYEEWSAILLTAISSKKEQNETIAEIKKQLPEYRGFVYKKLREMNLIWP